MVINLFDQETINMSINLLGVKIQHQSRNSKQNDPKVVSYYPAVR